MKRSEMIKHIAAELQVIACVVEGPRSIEMPRAGYFQRRAAGLLDIMEGLGMQPPNITLDELIPGLNVKHVNEETPYYACWEPEHETK